MPHRTFTPRVALALATTCLFWASAFAVIKSAGHAYGPAQLALFRFSAASLALGTAAFVRGRGGVRLPRGRDIAYFLLSGFLGVTLYHPFLNYGEQHISAGAASLLINSAPVWTAILAAPLLGEKVGARKAAGILVSFVGIALIVTGQTGDRLALEPAALFVLGSAVCAAFYVILQKKCLASWPALDFTLWTVAAGSLLLLPFYGLSTVRNVLSAPPRATLEVLYLGFFPAAIAYMTFAYATLRLPAATVMSFMYLVPPFAMLFAFLFIHEVPTALSIIGGAIALAGVAIVNTVRKPVAPVVAVEEA